MPVIPDTGVPQVSILMSLYNGLAFLDAAVESVLAQTFDDWELLIIDDGSSDGSLDRAREWEQRDSRIRVLRHPGGINRGVSATRNLGLAQAKAPWMAILDCDDLWLPNKLSQQIEIARAHPELVVIYAKAQVVDDDGRPVLESLPNLNRPPVFGNGSPDCAHDDFLGHLHFKYWIPASSALFAREASEACGNFDENLGYQVEDTLLWAQLAERGPMWFQDEILIHYRVHGNQWNSLMKPMRKTQGRYRYLTALNQRVDPAHRRATAEVLVDRGFDGLSRALISAHEIRPFRLIGYWFGLLGNRNVPWSLKGRATGMLLRQLLLMPFKALLLARRVSKRA